MGGGLGLLALAEHFASRGGLGDNRLLSYPRRSWHPWGRAAGLRERSRVSLQDGAEGLCSGGAPRAVPAAGAPALPSCGCCRTAPPAPAARTNDTAPGTAAAQHNVHFWCFWGVLGCFLVFFDGFFSTFLFHGVPGEPSAEDKRCSAHTAGQPSTLN